MERARALRQLKLMEEYGISHRLAAMDWDEPWKILISTIMSARTNDDVTIPVAEDLFEKYNTLKKLSRANLKDVERIINRVNFFRNKSKYVVACSKELVEKYNGKVPEDVNKLVELTGVGRKTANVFLSEMNHPAIGVDTHVAHLSYRLGWTKSKDPRVVENDLKGLFPRDRWKVVNLIMVTFGRTYKRGKVRNELLAEIMRI